MPSVTLVPGAEAWIVTNGERIRANVLKADQSHILLASDKLQTLHLLPASNNHRHFGRVGPKFVFRRLAGGANSSACTLKVGRNDTSPCENRSSRCSIDLAALPGLIVARGLFRRRPADAARIITLIGPSPRSWVMETSFTPFLASLRRLHELGRDLPPSGKAVAFDLAALTGIERSLSACVQSRHADRAQHEYYRVKDLFLQFGLSRFHCADLP